MMNRVFMNIHVSWYAAVVFGVLQLTVPIDLLSAAFPSAVFPSAGRAWEGRTPHRVRSDSLEHAGLAEALGGIFSPEKIATILSKLPPKSKIFGYDIGEYSGDDGMDVVLSAMREDVPRRTLDVHFFINDGAGFRLLRTLTRRYVLEPIEVGFSIDHGVCHVTEKTGEFSWRITGYSAAGGNFRRTEEWTTDRMRVGARVTGVGYERNYSYETLLSEEHYYGANTGKQYLRQRYYDLPVFPAELSLPDDMPVQAGDTTGLMISSGGSSWHGPDDCQVFVSARFDSNAVNFRVRVHDDRLLHHQSPDSADHLDLLFDLSRRNRVRPDGARQSYTKQTAFGIRILMGDGGTRTPVVELLGGELVGRYGGQVDVRSIGVPDQFQTYEFVIRVPLALFQLRGKPQPAGFVCAYHDVDHPGNLRWASIASTAREYEAGRPETYGRLHFVPDPVAAYEWENIRASALAAQLRRAGLLPRRTGHDASR